MPEAEIVLSLNKSVYNAKCELPSLKRNAGEFGGGEESLEYVLGPAGNHHQLVLFLD